MKTKFKEAWFCTECGQTQSKWSGSCFACKAWNTIQVFKEPEELGDISYPSGVPVPVGSIETENVARFVTGMPEFDRLMGGGIAGHSLTLLAGDPGIGKSTLMLEIASAFATKQKRVLYVSGEESLYQTSLRAERLSIRSDNLFVYAETNMAKIGEQVIELKPDLIVIDSIQIVYKPNVPSIPGSVTQVREVALELVKIAKRLGITVFAIGHVTKTGDLAGPRLLEHMVDTVLEFEGDLEHGFRILRSRKNRFGSTDEVAIYEMRQEGLLEVASPSALFLRERQNKVPGSVVTATIEGSRSILIEVQSLVAPTNYPTPTRRSTGIDQNRVLLLLAVLEKRVGMQIGFQDVFVSIAGGLVVKDPGIDLAVLFAIASSHANRPLLPECAMVGEVGLSGELRSAYRIEQRLKEIANMGFKECILPRMHEKVRQKGLELHFFSTAAEAVAKFL